MPIYWQPVMGDALQLQKKFMKTISLDFSQKNDLMPLAEVVRALQAVAQPKGINFFLMGAAARDLMLRHAHNIAPTRLTEDVDFAVMVPDWESFNVLRQGLIDSGEFAERAESAAHKLRHRQGRPLDIVPFGGIERADRTIAWPPDQHTVFDCFGAREAFDDCISVQLPGGVNLRVASIPALALLKVTAWQDRKLTHPGRDAGDLMLYMRHYLDCGNLNRAASEHGDLFIVEDYDHAVTGARLLGRDIARLLDKQSIQHVLGILQPQADAQGTLLLASQSGIDLEQARKLIEAICEGLTDFARK
jgi:predicted nucleotidyltransferase